jgi:hypothetical protein
MSWDVRSGSNREVRMLNWEVGFAPINGHPQRPSACLKSANFGSAPSLDDKICGAEQ